MSFAEFAELLKHINEEHSPIRPVLFPQRIVKYIDPVLDMRTNTIFSITFRGFGEEKNLNCVNENRELETSLFQRCMEYLDGEE